MLSAICTHSRARVSKTDKVCIIRHRCIENIGIIYGGWCVVKKRSKVSTFLKKISDNIDILSSVSNSTSPAATEMLAYFKREYYSRVWQNIDKPLPHRPYVLRRRWVSAWNVLYARQRDFSPRQERKYLSISLLSISSRFTNIFTITWSCVFLNVRRMT